MHTSTTQKHASAGKEVIDDSVERTNPSKLLNDPPTNNCFEDDRDRVQTLKAASLPSSQSPDAEPKFPVSCPVIREGFGGTEYAVANTIVTETYRNDKQNTGELLYVLDSGRTCTEKDLQFGIHTPVWFHAENGDYVVATVLSVTFHPTVPGKEPSYCIQELESKQVYLDVSGQFLHYRHAEEDDYYYELQEQREGLCNYYTNDGTTNQEYAVADKGSSEQETHEKQQRDAANNGMSSQHPAIANLRGYSELWDETGQDDHIQFDKECRGTANQDHTTNATANLSSSELETEKKCSTLFEKSDGKAIAHEIDEDRKKHFLVPLPEEIADSTKRPKKTHHFLLRIPNWTPLESVTELLQGPLKDQLESETNCQIRLRGRAVEAASPLCLKMCVELESEHKDAINAAITGIEDYVVGCIANTDQKRLMMHDFALVNTTRTVEDNAHSDGSIEAVYQREFLFQNHDHAASPSLFKWMCVVPFPVQAGGGRDAERLVVGPKGAGIREMGGDAGCFVWVSRDNLSRGFVYVSGDSRQEVESCATRAKHRIQWAVRRFKEILKERLQKNSRSN